MFTLTAAQNAIATTLGVSAYDVIAADEALTEMGILPTLTMVRVYLAGYEAGYDAGYVAY